MMARTGEDEFASRYGSYAAQRLLAITGLVVAFVLVGLVGVATYYGGMLDHAIRSIHRDHTVLHHEHAAPLIMASGPLDLLLLPTETTAQGSRLGPAAIVARLSADRRTVHLVGIPRSMQLAVPGHGIASLTQAYAWGGNALTARAVEDTLDITLSHFMTADIADLEDIAATISTDSRGVVMEAALSRVSTTPEYALSGRWLHARANTPDDELLRAQGELAFLQTLIRGVAGNLLVSDPWRYAELATRLSESLVVDDHLSVAHVWQLALDIRLGASCVDALMVPVRASGGRLVADPVPLVELVAALRDDDLRGYAKSHP